MIGEFDKKNRKRYYRDEDFMIGNLKKEREQKLFLVL